MAAYRGAWVLRESARRDNWRNVNTGEVVTAPRTASVSELYRLAGRNPKKIRVEISRGNIYGADSQFKSPIVAKLRKQALEVAARRRERLRK